MKLKKESLEILNKIIYWEDLSARNQEDQKTVWNHETESRKSKIYVTDQPLSLARSKY